MPVGNTSSMIQVKPSLPLSRVSICWQLSQLQVERINRVSLSIIVELSKRGHNGGWLTVTNRNKGASRMSTGITGWQNSVQILAVCLHNTVVFGTLFVHSVIIFSLFFILSLSSGCLHVVLTTSSCRERSTNWRRPTSESLDEADIYSHYPLIYWIFYNHLEISNSSQAGIIEC